MMASTRAEGFRADIEGLRAVAIVMVVLYHAGVPWVPGGYIGVDVFFVLSGYLITGIVAHEVESTGRLSVLGFYARRARRLMPASAVVVLTTLVAMVVVYSPIELREYTRSASAVSIYASNILFAIRSTDYLDAAAAGDPLLHTWSLSVEEQFYVVWPALLLALYLVGRRIRRPVMPIAGITALAVASFAACIVVTGVRQPWAFFLSPFRFWEFAVGGIAALLPASRRIGASASARWIGPFGMVALGACAVGFDEATLFPGAMAALPVLATVAVLVAGAGDAGPGGHRTPLLARPVLQWLGRHSYSWYLWHWPFLMVTLALAPDASVPARIAVVGGALGLSVATFLLIEQPARQSTWLRVRPGISVAGGLALAGICLVASVGVGRYAAAQLTTPEQRRIQFAASDTPALYEDGCAADWETIEPVTEGCVYGDRDAATTIALFGDSHAAHWFPAMEEAAREEGWRIVVYVKNACPSVDVKAYRNPRLGRTYTECVTWRERVVRHLAETKPDLVVLSNLVRDVHLLGEGDQRPIWAQGLTRMALELEEASIPSLVITDIPAPETNVPNCLSRAAGPSLVPAPDCSFDRDAAPNQGFAALDRAAMEATSSGRAIDFDEVICPEQRCEVDRDEQIIFSDANHLTATYSRSLMDALGAEIKLMVSANP